MTRANGKNVGISLLCLATAAAFATTTLSATEQSDLLLDLFVKKGIITEEEAQKLKGEAAALAAAGATNAPPVMPESKWKLSNAIKNIEIFGDIRLRYEDREGHTPGGQRLELDRGRYSARFGVRGEAFDDFYYGLRFDTGANPRSAWVTFGTSSSGVPYQGPYGKSTGTVTIGQAYIGWRPASWADFEIGKVPNPLYTTSMVWDGDINPEGIVERFTYNVGAADVFATFGQFYYQDTNPNYASGGLGVGINSLTGQDTDNVFMFAWQGGVNYRFTTDVSARIAATLYNYIGLTPNTPPYFGDPYVGEGAYLGPGTGTTDGASGWNPNATATTPGYYDGFPNNQTGLKNLLIVEVPFEFDFKISRLDARFFGDLAYNLEGSDRAKEASSGYAAYLAANSGTISTFKPQTDDVKAYQVGLALGNSGSLGLVNGTTSRRHGWEIRTYWQHIEQYALDPNLVDSDFFEGRSNLQGIYAAVAYGLGQNVIVTFRYGNADRINDKLGTGGSNQDIPQINPFSRYQIFQLDLTLKL